MEPLSEVDEDTIYFGSLHKIEKEMENILKERFQSRLVQSLIKYLGLFSKIASSIPDLVL
jgi:hypothetical protein